jgi:fumarate reductase flavoprotein subunit
MPTNNKHSKQAAMIAADVVILGGGLAGLVAANRLSQLGRKSVVLEQGESDKYPCNARFAGGVFHVSYCDPMRPPAELRSAIDAATGGTASPELADAVANHAGRLLEWLQSEGASFARGGEEEYRRYILVPLRPAKTGMVWEGNGSDVLMQTLERNLVGRGGRLVRGSRAVTAERVSGRWSVRTEGEVRVDAKSLIIADGGFQGNAELVGRYISPQPDRVFQRGAGTGCGDGLKIALALGAKTIGMDRFYGHVLVADALTKPGLWPYPWLDPVAAGGMVVDSEGNRFVDEGKGGVFIANAVARLADPLSAFAIFDDTVWQGPGARGVIPPNPNLVPAGGTLHEAGTLEELSLIIGIDAASLSRSVAAYNAALLAGQGSVLSPPRSGGAQGATPLLKPPFRATRLIAGMTYTMGGIAIDGHSRVLSDDGSVISGLYAAGGAAGGIEGGPNHGYVGGLITAGVTALRAAEHLSETA